MSNGDGHYYSETPLAPPCANCGGSRVYWKGWRRLAAPVDIWNCRKCKEGGGFRGAVPIEWRTPRVLPLVDWQTGHVIWEGGPK